MPTYPPEVERWRSLASKYIKPEDLDKFLYVIQWESSGNPDARSDSGGYGLTQLNDGGLGEGLSIAERLDPETNIRTAAAAIYGGSGWAPWGEGSEQYNYPYDPKTGKGRFGSLGDRPYPGGTGLSGGSGGGPSNFNSDGEGGGITDPTYLQLRDHAQQLWEDWLEGGADPDDDTYYEALEAMEAADSYASMMGIDPRATGENTANDRVSQWATIENVNNDRASNVISAWANKTSAAMDAAKGAMDAAADDSESRIAIQEARNASSTPGLLPRNLTAGAIAPKWDKVLQKYREQMGAGAMPEFDRIEPPAPSTGGGTGATAGGGYTITSQHLPVKGDPPGPAGGPENYGPAPGQYGSPPGMAGGPENYGPAPADYGKPGDFGDGGDGGGVSGWDIINGLAIAGNPIGSATGYAHKKLTIPAAKKAAKWFGKKFFAEGGSNIEAGEIVVGDGGEPEFLYHPSFGVKPVGLNGPERIQVPEGASIIPLNEAQRYMEMQKGMAAQVPAAGGDRENDPEGMSKAMESLQRAMSANYASNPPLTPTPRDGAPDLFAEWRGLSGVPYDPTQQQQQPAAPVGAMPNA